MFHSKTTIISWKSLFISFLLQEILISSSPQETSISLSQLISSLPSLQLPPPKPTTDPTPKPIITVESLANLLNGPYPPDYDGGRKVAITPKRKCRTRLRPRFRPKGKIHFVKKLWSLILPTKKPPGFCVEDILAAFAKGGEGGSSKSQSQALDNINIHINNVPQTISHAAETTTTTIPPPPSWGWGDDELPEWEESPQKNEKTKNVGNAQKNEKTKKFGNMSDSSPIDEYIDKAMTKLKIMRLWHLLGQRISQLREKHEKLENFHSPGNKSQNGLPKVFPNGQEQFHKNREIHEINKSTFYPASHFRLPLVRNGKELRNNFPNHNFGINSNPTEFIPMPANIPVLNKLVDRVNRNSEEMTMSSSNLHRSEHPPPDFVHNDDDDMIFNLRNHHWQKNQEKLKEEFIRNHEQYQPVEQMQSNQPVVHKFNHPIHSSPLYRLLKYIPTISISHAPPAPPCEGPPLVCSVKNFIGSLKFTANLRIKM
ncbi:hypothetical protein Fcan01_20427 [Folsomia candida]|uniref:Uncharacterized protein n=1 Tax=Folsomia candida TaxID=158441 RepID=A0A226DGI7_FOLCA|nr:hypothetical protein Fcan01_20427 [Folsomia candida]